MQQLAVSILGSGGQCPSGGGRELAQCRIEGMRLTPLAFLVAPDIWGSGKVSWRSNHLFQVLTKDYCETHKVSIS